MAKSKVLRSTAFHEAGHAFAAWMLGIKFISVTIKPGPHGSLGHIKFGPYPKWFNPSIDSSDRAQALAHRHIVALMAAQIAESKYLRKTVTEGMGADNTHATDLADCFVSSHEALQAYLHYCSIAARDLIIPRFKAVKLIADVLLERKTLTYREVAKIMLKPW